SMSNEKLRKALNNGYEVEPEYGVEDWVTHENGVISKITSIDDRGIITTDHPLNSFRGNGDRAYMNTLARYFKHSTPEEVADEKFRRSEVKLSEIIHDLTIKEKQRLRQILNSCGDTNENLPN